MGEKGNTHEDKKLYRHVWREHQTCQQSEECATRGIQSQRAVFEPIRSILYAFPRTFRDLLGSKITNATQDAIQHLTHSLRDFLDCKLVEIQAGSLSRNFLEFGVTLVGAGPTSSVGCREDNGGSCLFSPCASSLLSEELSLPDAMGERRNEERSFEG